MSELREAVEMSMQVFKKNETLTGALFDFESAFPNHLFLVTKGQIFMQHSENCAPAQSVCKIPKGFE